MDVVTGETKEDSYDVLVLGTGAKTFTPPPFNQGAYNNVFQVRNIQDNRDIIAYPSLKQPKKAVLVDRDTKLATVETDREITESEYTAALAETKFTVSGIK